MMTVNVLLFGPQAAATGKRQIQVMLKSAAPTCRDLHDALRRHGPALRASLGVSRIAVNQRIAAWDQMIHPEDELAVIGLVGGG